MVPIPPFGNAEDRVYDTPLAAVFCCDERPDEGDRSKLVFFLLPLPFVDILTMSDYFSLPWLVLSHATHHRLFMKSVTDVVHADILIH